MTTFEVTPIRITGLHSETVDPTGEDGTVRLCLIGAAEGGAMRPLDEYLKRVHAKLVELSMSEVTIDLRELEFMNSSCFKAFVTWLGDLQDLDAEHQYRVRFVSNEKLHWQRRSLDALRRFANGLVRVDT